MHKTKLKIFPYLKISQHCLYPVDCFTKRRYLGCRISQGFWTTETFFLTSSSIHVADWKIQLSFIGFFTVSVGNTCFETFPGQNYCCDALYYRTSPSFTYVFVF